MPRYLTLDVDGAERALLAAKLEPIIVDGKLMAVQVGALRIYSEGGKRLVVSGHGEQP